MHMQDSAYAYSNYSIFCIHHIHHIQQTKHIPPLTTYTLFKPTLSIQHLTIAFERMSNRNVTITKDDIEVLLGKNPLKPPKTPPNFILFVKYDSPKF
jgi:hypothetical protein